MTISEYGVSKTNVSKPGMLWRNFPASWGLTSTKTSLGAASVEISQNNAVPSAEAPHKKPATGGNVPEANKLSGEKKTPLFHQETHCLLGGFLVLDADTGRFKIDGPTCSQRHIQDLRFRLDSGKEHPSLAPSIAWKFRLRSDFFHLHAGEPCELSWPTPVSIWCWMP